MQADEAIVNQIIRRYGKVIDLKKEPGVIIDIIRQFGPRLTNGGLPPGGTPPPPGPTSFQGGQPAIRDLMKEVLKISREIAVIKKHLGA